jgi:hypothetical protein
VLYEVSRGSTKISTRPQSESALDVLLPSPSDGPTALTYHSRREWYLEQLAIYFMDLPEFHPRVEAERKRTVENHEVPVIEVSIGRTRLEYYLDPSTFLTFRLVKKTYVAGFPEPNVEEFWLSDYIRAGGVWFPRSIKRSKDQRSTIRYEINVPYDKDLFQKEPTISVGANGWRPGDRL